MMTSGILYADTHPAHWYRWYYLSQVIPEESLIMGYQVPTWEVWIP